MLMIKLLVAIPFVMGTLSFAYALNDDVRNVSDFKVEKVKYSEAYIYTYGISRRYHAIKIKAEGKEFHLYPHENFLPAGMTLERIATLLSQTTEAVVWTEKNDDINSVRGIETEYLNIPPSQGVNFHAKERRYATWAGVILFICGNGVYFYFKKYFGLDWKLDFYIPKSIRRKRR
jgi:hypothetical protein